MTGTSDRDYDAKNAMAIPAVARSVDDVSSCVFYHSIDLPVSGFQEGQWDLRGRFDDYLGGQEIAGKSLLDVGTASGFLTFEAEKRGARVTSFDVASADRVFVLPFHDSIYVQDYPAYLAWMEQWLERLKNSYWLCHRELGSSAACIYGDVFELGPDVGVFDVVLVGQILIHLRDGLSALAAAATTCRETLIIVEGSFENDSPIAALQGRAERPEVAYAWYQYSHGWYREVLAMLGFSIVDISTGIYRCNGPEHANAIELTTIVATSQSPL